MVFYDSDGRCDGPAHNASRIYQSCGNPAAADLSVFTEPDEPYVASAARTPHSTSCPPLPLFPCLARRALFVLHGDRVTELLRAIG